MTPAEDLAPENLVAEDQPHPYRWVMLGLVLMVYTCFGISAGSLAPLVETMREDLGISSSGMGIILGAWQLTYVFSSYALGTLVDRLGVRKSMGLGIAIVALGLALRAAAVDFYSLFFFVALLGVGGPIISIGAPKMAAIWFVGRGRGMGAGIYNAGPAIGGFLVLALTNSVVVPLTGHWRLSFVAYGAVALIATAVWWLLARDAPQGNPARPAASYRTESEAEPSAIETFKLLLKTRNVQIVLLLAFASFFLNHGLTQWLPTVFTDRGMSDARAGYLAAIPMLVGIPGLLSIPYLLHHGLRGKGLVVLMMTSALAILGLFSLGGPALIGTLVVSGVSNTAIMPVMTLVLMETPGVGRRHIGAAAGIFFTFAEVGGFTGPLFLGLLRDLTDTLTSGLVMLAVVSGIASLAAFLIIEGRQER